MKKLFTLLTMLVVAISASAVDIVPSFIQDNATNKVVKTNITGFGDLYYGSRSASAKNTVTDHDNYRAVKGNFVFELAEPSKIDVTFYSSSSGRSVKVGLYTIDETTFQVWKSAGAQTESTIDAWLVANKTNMAADGETTLEAYYIAKGFKTSNNALATGSDNQKNLLPESTNAASGITTAGANVYTQVWYPTDATSLTRYESTTVSVNGGSTIPAGKYIMTIGDSGSNVGIEKITVTTAGAVDPTFSLSKASIGTNETAQIKVGSNSDLDGITLSDITYGTSGIVTVDASGAVTPVAAGTTTINFSSSAVENKYNAKTNNQVSITVTAPTYTVTYDLNGGNGTAPTQADTEEGGKFNLAAAPTKDFSTFAGWLCDADGQTYDAEAEYEMTAANTKFTAQWNVTTYSSTLDFAGATLAGTTGEKTIEEFLADGNMTITGKGSRSGWEASTENFGFLGYKLKDQGVTVKFMAEAGKKVTITLGSNDGAVTLKKNGVSSTIASHKGNSYCSVIAFDADEDILVEISTTVDNKTTTLNKIAIEDAWASTNVTVGETGFATIGLPYATTLPTGVKAYAVSEVSATSVTVSDAIAAGTTIPANKGFIIVADPQTYTFNQFANDTWQGDAANKLEATGSSVKNATAAGDFYYFSIINAEKKKVGFKKCSATATLAANKAYLPGSLVPTTSNNTLTISFEGEATAINGVAEEASDAAPVKVVTAKGIQIGKFNVAGHQVK